MTKHAFARHLERWIQVFAAHEADSPQGRATVLEMIAVGRAACLLPDDVVELAASIGKAVHRMREVEMRALAAGVGIQ